MKRKEKAFSIIDDKPIINCLYCNTEIDEHPENLLDSLGQGGLVECKKCKKKFELWSHIYVNYITQENE